MNLFQHKYCLSPMDERRLQEACAKIKHVALDMDGTIYLGDHLFPYTMDFLSALTRMGITYSFLTNNPTKSVNDYLSKLKRMGIEASHDEMYTSAVATIDYIRINHPDVKRLFLLGTPSMQTEFLEAGFELCEDSPEDIPDMLVVAFDTTLTYSRLCRATWWAAQGIRYIATNPDRVCPTNLPVILVDCGSLCAAIEHAVGRKPDAVIGKPNPDMLRCIMQIRKLLPNEVAMCGDRIYTDVATADAAGALGVLVLSGETTLEVARNAKTPPPIVAPSVAEFGKMLALTH